VEGGIKEKERIKDVLGNWMDKCQGRKAVSSKRGIGAKLH
jgi:hypothetical protein